MIFAIRLTIAETVVYLQKQHFDFWIWLLILIFGGISHFIDETKERNANREIEKAREKERDGGKPRTI